MTKPKKAIIIGGGASGIATAYSFCVGKNPLSPDEFVLFEQNDRLGKKLSATGNGQCNISNKSIGQENYYGDKKLIAEFLKGVENFDLTAFFYGLGIPLCEDKGKIYPLSKQANSVIDAFRQFFNYYGANIITSAKVSKIEKRGEVFSVTANGQTYLAEKIVFAVGGKAGKQYGTDGSSYSLIEKFGHTLTPLYPSIVQLKTDKEKIKTLKGHKENAVVTAIVNGREVKRSKGDILFTDYGVSGNAIFSISSAVTGEKNAQLKVEFLPDYSLEQITKIIADKKSNLSYILPTDLLSGIINKKIGEAIVKNSKDPASAQSIAQSLKDFRLNVLGSMGYDYAQVTKGGISGKEVNPTTLESTLVKGLYIVGEALDVDGDCGGYNLTFAFENGFRVARRIMEN